MRERLNYGENMKIENNFIKSLIKEDNPIPYVWQNLWSIWIRHANGDLKDYYYRGEEEAFLFEDFLLKTYDEFFTRELPKACLNEPSPFQNPPADTCFIVMDGMSIREGALIFKALQKEGFASKINYSFSSVPSDTQSFREKIKSDLAGSEKFVEINNPKKIRVSGEEKYIWSYFPDVLLDKIQVGHTVVSDLENMYKTSEKIVFELLREINSKKIIILSDHGYIRSEPGFSFSVPEDRKKKLREIFGSSRFITMDKADLSELVIGGYIAEFSGYYLVKSRYIWPVSGKYNIYLHGGISLMECFVPVIEVER
ncbi:MAG: hypothetical protein K6T16_02260 [Candidatus Pacearchaeota archaeon]|nr:hypothetical protein [Candidatus Pacearchaeota archaeon]